MRVTIRYPTQVISKSNNQYRGEEKLIIGRPLGNGQVAPVTIPASILFGHTLIVGSTGSGQTWTAAFIIKSLHRLKPYKYRIIVLDWHGEYSSLLEHYVYIDPYDAPVNIVDPGTLSWLEILYDVLGLTDPQAYLLQKIVAEISPSTLIDIKKLYGLIEQKDYDEAKWLREVKYALLRRLAPLVYGDNYRLFSAHKDFLATFRKKNTYVVDLSRIRDIRVKNIYATFIARYVFDYALRNIVPNTILVIEEAHNLLSKSNSSNIISRMLSEIRKFGVGVIVVTQSPSGLDDDIMKNTGSKIVHSIKSSIDLEIISKSLVLNKRVVSIIPYLEPGEAVVALPNYKKPLLVKIGDCFEKP